MTCARRLPSSRRNRSSRDSSSPRTQYAGYVITPAPASHGPAPVSRARTLSEIGVVLALSLGASAVYAVVSLIERLSREAALNEQTTTIHRSLAERPGFDLTYQLLGFIFGLAPVALVIFLTWQRRRPHLSGLGLDRPRWFSETAGGFGLAALIGMPGIALYVVARQVGLNLTVVPTALDTHWWTLPVLILHALRAALVEELIVVAYLFNRLEHMRMKPAAIIVTSALLRGTYHLYQGFGGFIGNFIMGLVFGWVYHRTRRAIPLVTAHWILDIVSFTGFALAVTWWPQWFGTG